MQVRSSPEILRAPTVTLRPLREEDKADRLACGRQAEYVRMVGGDSRNLRPFAREDANRWFAESAREPFLWAIEAGGRCVGTARLHHLDEANRRARYAVGIFDPSAWGRGLGTEATEGVEREGALIADEWQTDVLMSILKQEYREAARTWWPEASGAPDA